MMKYKGYLGHVVYDDEAKIFHGEVIGIKDMITFQGDCVEDLEKSFRDSVNDYLSFCEERGESPDKSYSGRFNIRISPQLHAKLNIMAREKHESINSFINHTLEKAVG